MLDFFYGVGHGRRPDGRLDLGARGDDGRYEHHEVHEIAAYVATAADRSGLTYVIEGHGTDSDEEDPNFVGSINTVNSGSFRVALEGHMEWSKGPDKWVGLHAGSSGGTRMAKALASRAREQGLPLGANGAGQAVDEKYGRKVRLAFPRRTNPPAVLIEYARVGDRPAEMNRKMGEATVAAICDFVGKRYIPPRPASPDFTVAVVWGGDADFGMAAMLGKRFAFKLLTDEEVLAGAVSVGYAVAVGENRQAVIDKVGDGFEVGGASRYETADRVYALLMGDAPDRRRPWA